ncbi:MAG TPA: CsbD family protein [Bryobacteraceae bacterium]
MNKDEAAGKWQQVKGKLKQQWGKLTDDDLTILEGSRDRLAGQIQERYGIAKEDAERQVREFRERNRDMDW